MALHQLTSLPPSTLNKLPPANSLISVASSGNNETIVRRSANYKPSIWGFDYVQSLKSEYVGESCAEHLKKLKQDVRLMLTTEVDPLHQLELIDDLQRLGISYHFEDEIKSIMSSIYDNSGKKESLYAVALEFRLLRQHGYDVSAEIFNDFKDGKGNFKSWLKDDCKAILSLYEAAFLLKESESLIFHDIRNFTTSHLEDFLKDNKDQYLSTLVGHELELPRYWRIIRLEARWFIDVYETRPGINNIMLEFAKLDFNMVQAIHQEDMKSASRWWSQTCLAEKLTFARDRMIENFLWSIGLIFEPEFNYCRKMSTRNGALITVIDDVYDVYGTLDELELFTDAVDRWDISAIEQLPDYMKICFLVLFNTINEMGLDALKAHEFNIIPYLRKAWADLCKSYLVEAKWYHSGYIPTLEEYIENGWVSITIPMILVHAYFFTTNPITKEALDILEECGNIIRWSSLIIRLVDDLGTSSDELKRGDVPKSIQCYMHETGASEEAAREHIKEMITVTWMKMNKERLENPHFFVKTAINLARMGQCMYQYGDGHAIQEHETKDRVLSLIVNPIPFTYGNQK